MKLTIELKNTGEEAFIKELLQKLNVTVVKNGEKATKNQAKAFEALQQIADRGVVARELPEPTQWQIETRRDVNLPFNGE